MNRKNIEDAYPLSPMQEGMLFHSLLAPTSGVYIDQLRFDLHGNLDVSAFAQAWQQVIARHPVLRTAFVWEGLEKPIQVVVREVNIPWEYQDWQQFSAIEQQEQLETLLQEDQRGFELSKAPLMRFTLIQIAEATYHFIWSHHHLLLDGWSLPLIFQEVISYYKAFCQSESLFLAQPRPYRDYIAWLQQQNLSQAEAFWREKLKNFTAPTQLWVDQNPGQLPNQEASYEQQKTKLSVATTTALKSLAQQQHLTPNILIQGAWALLLSCYSSELDIVFGAAVSGRPYSLINVESMVGNFINTLPVRVQVNSEEFLLPWLKQIQAQQLESQQYEYSPLVEVQGWSEVPRGVPLFETLLVFENYPLDLSLQGQIENLQIRSVDGFQKTNYPLELTVEVGAEFSFSMAYSCHRFDTATVTRMLGHLQNVLESIVANPHQRLEELSLLTVDQRYQLLMEWSEGREQGAGGNEEFIRTHDLRLDLSIHELFEAQVERTPDAVAVVFEDQQLTYHELNARANQLAHYLQSVGVKPEVLVGLCVERSLEMVVGLLGILKAGGAYLPLDPTYPSQRLAFMVEDAQISVLLTQEKLVAGLPEQGTRICLDAEWGLISRESRENRVGGVTPENLAYVIYTSGSTGRPKGVMIQHHSLVNFTKTAIATYALTQRDRILQFASISFDAAAEEIYPCLSCGATLVLRTDEMLSSGSRFEQKCRDLALTVLDLPTAYWHELTEDLATADLVLPQSLRLVIIGGEQALGERVITWQKYAGNSTLVNTYGPTETTVVATTYKLAADIFSKLPIGRAISNVQTYVLDRCLKPVPIGVAGELYISGVNLARGYLNRPELTAQKFIPHPFSTQLGARLYKTGDLVRYLPDGNIEFLGRTDEQVKSRGFRIEIGEIETVLSQHPEVKETAIAAREDVPSDKRLVAYVVARQQLAPTTSDLRRFLSEKLPPYMIPAVFVQIAALPLTPSGKVDRRSLPVPSVRSEVEVAHAMPQTEVEQAIATVWQQVLNIAKVGIHDNFFEIGGHSLLMLKVNSQLREIFKTDLSIVEMFRYPTINSLANYFGQANIKTSFAEVDINLEKIKYDKNKQKKRLQKMHSIRNN
ncbi:MAG: amino acid adenylation domain-containing protein [Gloeocapsa sp. UFS-A4-WI-NPMV-4B04]|jgi:amino acid adenylation domain-containing protein|nr:amino acid adenylation domain-containing protein [Gloeocapsa sp. UFS-A4-WI-NPMV-4B04]